MNPADAEAYYNRGLARLRLHEWENAKADLITSKDLGFNIATAFYNDYEIVADFEIKHEVRMPKDIKTLLSRG